MKDEEWSEGLVSGKADAEYEITALKERLSEAEALLFNIQDIDLYPQSQTIVSKILKIREFLNPPNPADNPDNCLACMGATGSAVRHTCKRQ